MLEYMDDVLGRLFDWVEHSKLRDNTYVLVMGDNGAELFPEERKGMHRQVQGGLKGRGEESGREG
jgi:arylsulfatase A-like enzyme